MRRDIVGGGIVGRKVVVWDASPLPAELATVEALARLKLLARRCGVELRLRGAAPELHELIDLSGLGDFVSTAHALVQTRPWSFRHQP
jgi:hypothetical protein